MKNPERRYELDWLRVLAVLLLLYFHTAAIFYQGDLGTFYVTNAQTSSAIALFILWVHQWHMPLLFFLSGAASWFSLKTRTAGGYAQERVQRLFIPLVLGILTLVPPQVYYHHIQTTGEQISYLQFYPQFFNGIRPIGNFEWAHLWFIAYLLVFSLVFSLVGLPFFLWIKQFLERSFAKLNWVTGEGTLFYLALPLCLIEALFRPRWAGFQNLYDDWANVLLYFTYFVYGYVFEAEPRIAQKVDRQQSLITIIALGGMSVLLALWMMDAVPERGYSLRYMAYQAFRGFNAGCWVMALLSWGRSHLNFNHGVLQYANEASYPFYILHQSIVVAVGFYVVSWQTGIPQKFVTISFGALVLTLGLYELLVRRFNLVRFCLGLKPAAVSQKFDQK